MKVYNQNKLHKRLRREMGNAIADFNMIEEGDRVMVCMSGGKDSYTMLDILMNLKISAPVNFELVAVHLALNHPQYPAHVLPDYLSNLGVEYHIITENIYQIVTEKSEKSKSPCSLCSRLRRGILYRVAREIGATKIALGHHRDDILETLFLNMFYGGKMKAMPPKLLNDTGEHVLIRPLAYCKEKDIINYAQVKAFPIIPCGYCGFEPNVQRQVIKQMFQEWDKKFPGRIETMFRATQNVTLSHLCDNNLFDFKGIKKDDAIVDSRCITFDRELDLPTNDK